MAKVYIIILPCKSFNDLFHLMQIAYGISHKTFTHLEIIC